MSTRSNIVQKVRDDLWRVIYVHSDGYLSGLGQMLFTNYQTNEKVTELVDLGDLSSVDEVPGEKHPFGIPGEWNSPEHRAHEERFGYMTRAYHRDRGEEWEDVKPAECRTYEEAMAACGQEFVYYWDGTRWFWAEGPDRGGQAPFAFEPLTPEAWQDE